MEGKSTPKRGIPLDAINLWKFNIAKEDELRLQWFKRNEPRLEEIANRENARKVPSAIKAQNKQNIVESFQNVKRHAIVIREKAPPVIDEAALQNIMRPVDPETTKMLFSKTVPDGRVKYLTERCKLIPEKRYYFPETTSFVYGWNMWDSSKKTPQSPFARSQVLKQSFYRRRGVERDADWYSEPAKQSPGVCGCI